MNLLEPNRNSYRLTGKRIGRGFFNKLIDKLPIELHLPGYNFCGPGTKLEKRLSRGDRGVNPLDEACKKHDIAYTVSSNLKFRHDADRALYKAAKERIRNKESTLGEKVASSAVAALMKAKVAVGMGVGRKRNRTGRRPLKKVRTRVKRGGAISFVDALRFARNAISRSGAKNLLTNVKAAYGALKKIRKRISEPRGRVIRIPKTGGFLPLIPLFAALGALGSIGGGAAAIARTINNAKTAREQLDEERRHNKAMEAKAVGSGFYIKPYKKGCGLFIEGKGNNVGGTGYFNKPYKKGCGITTSSKN
ncbi:uncharacterized protein [Onthophagus taurus]|uniref:uncharacterized protein isoform X1 n=1 Tax=Onthophagus taurus TaxID=166361 RepID=UPI0039BE3DB4